MMVVAGLRGRTAANCSSNTCFASGGQMSRRSQGDVQQLFSSIADARQLLDAKWIDGMNYAGRRHHAAPRGSLPQACIVLKRPFRLLNMVAAAHTSRRVATCRPANVEQP